MQDPNRRRQDRLRYLAGQAIPVGQAILSPVDPPSITPPDPIDIGR